MADNNKDKIIRMHELVNILNEAAKAYYAQDREIMSDFDYDRLYDELQSLEKETGTVLSSSPSLHVGYEAVDELPRERHEKPMLSLDKTKDREALRAFMGRNKTLLSWKLDGLTIVLTYTGGALVKAVTRGNGEVGEVVTQNARVFKNLPVRIPFTKELVIRGEAVISYPDFEKINEKLGEEASRYKNPRNLCSGSVRQLNSEVTAKRNVRFFAFSLVRAEGADFQNSHRAELSFLKEQGFDTVEYILTDADGLDEAFDYFEKKIVHYEIPSDGLVAIYDDIAYGESLGRTAKFPRNAIAFKWKDELAETSLIKIEWSPSRTGLINPVAIFEPVELEGTTVSRASVHNISIVRSLKLGAGDRVTVYKANMIIPQIQENLTCSDNIEIADKCPACGMPTSIHNAQGVETLFCENPDCPAKKIKSFTQFVSRDAMNIDGLSEMTLEKLIGRGFIHRYGDLFRLKSYRDEIINLEGFGRKSFENLEQSVEKARKSTLPRLLFALGIPNIGVANARLISRAFGYDLEKVKNSSIDELTSIDGVGELMAKAFRDWFADSANEVILEDLMTEISLEAPEAPAGAAQEGGGAVEGKTFVITGSVERFKNRNELKARIESEGGKVTGSVSKKTDYLINNDAASSSTKNRTARELGIPIITEDEFLGMLQK